MKNIYLIRHAQSAANAMAGQTVQWRNDEIPITALGETQAQHLAQWLAANVPPPDAVFTSPYLRTQQTAAPFLRSGSLKSQILPDLHEFNYLSYEHIHGKNSAELSALAEAYWQRNDADYRDGADCDSFASFFGQINAVRDYFRTLPDGNYVVFGHGFWIGILLWQLIGRGGGCQMAAFRSFEPHVRPRNTEVFLWQLGDAAESIVKVRRLAD